MNKRKMITILYVMLFLLPGILYADGPPITAGQIDVPHQTITLSKKQIHQAGKYRYIELTNKQKKQLYKIANTKIPPLLEIITAPYNDCACGLLFYGLWATHDEVQIPDNTLKYLHEYYDDAISVRTISDAAQKMSLSVLNIDMNGNVYQKGVKVNNLTKAILTTSKIPADEKYLFVNTPPIVSDAFTATISNVYINIKDFFVKKDVKVYSYFENEYIINELKGYNKLPSYTAIKINEKIERYRNGCSVSCNTSWKIKASSQGTWKDHAYTVSQLNDALTSTAWVEGVPGHGISEKIIFYDFKSNKGGPIAINGLVLYNGYIKNKDLFEKNSRVKSFVLYVNDEPRYLLHVKDIRDAQKIEFPGILLTDKDEITLSIVDIFGGLKYQDTAITLLLPYYEKI